MTLTVLWSTAQVFCQMTLSWDLSDIFLKIGQGLRVLGRKSTEANCHFSFHHIKGTCYQHGFSVLTLTRSPGRGSVYQFLHCKATLSSSSYCPLWKEVTTHSPQLRGGSYTLPPCRGSIYIKYLDFFCMGGLFVHLHLILDSSFMSV